MKKLTKNQINQIKRLRTKGHTFKEIEVKTEANYQQVRYHASKVDKELRVKEHQYPRKISSKELFTNPPKSVEELKEMYYNRYGVWNWVTKTENSSLRKYQKDGKFKLPEKSYNDCGIKLIRFK